MEPARPYARGPTEHARPHAPTSVVRHRSGVGSARHKGTVPGPSPRRGPVAGWGDVLAGADRASSVSTCAWYVGQNCSRIRTESRVSAGRAWDSTRSCAASSAPSSLVLVPFRNASLAATRSGRWWTYPSNRTTRCCRPSRTRTGRRTQNARHGPRRVDRRRLARARLVARRAGATGLVALWPVGVRVADPPPTWASRNYGCATTGTRSLGPAGDRRDVREVRTIGS